jgi:hypothetical protein
VALVVAVAGCSSSSQQASQQGDSSSSQGSAKSAATSSSSQGTEGITIYNPSLRNVRYCEIFFYTKTDSGVDATLYGTWGLDTGCPADKFNALNADELAKQYGVDQVYLNGIRNWTLDQNVLRNVKPKVKSIGGIDVRQGATFQTSGKQLPPYTEQTIDRNSQWWYEQGKPVYLLINHNDNKWYVMQSYSQIVDKNQKESDLMSLGSRLDDLPDGWEYKISILTKNLALPSVDDKAHIIQDKYLNTYMLLTDDNGKSLPVPQA